MKQEQTVNKKWELNHIQGKARLGMVMSGKVKCSKAGFGEAW